MAKIMVLAESGFGKTSSLGKNDELGIMGLDPEKTVIIQATSKGLPFPGSKKKYSKAALVKGEDGKTRIVGNIIVGTPEQIVKMIGYFLKGRPKVENFVYDDFNFHMQDYYMENAKKGGNAFDVFKDIGKQTFEFLKQIDTLNDSGKNVILMAHPEIYEDLEGRNRYRLKTVGAMVSNFLTPEGKFEIVLMGYSRLNPETKLAEKLFVTNDDGQYNAKSPYGIFKDIYIKNDMGKVLEKIKEYENQE